MRTWTPLRQAPAVALQQAAGATIVEDGSWRVAVSFDGLEAERRLLEETVGVSDVTSRAKVDVRGRLGGVLGAAQDALVCAIAAEWAIVLGAPDAEADLTARLRAAAGPDVMVTDVTDLFAGYAVAGPLVSDLFARMTSWDPRTLADGKATGAPVAGMRAVIRRRDLDVRVYEVYVAAEFGRFAWGRLIDVATELGGGPVGRDALRAGGWR